MSGGILFIVLETPTNTHTPSSIAPAVRPSIVTSALFTLWIRGALQMKLTRCVITGKIT